MSLLHRLVTALVICAFTLTATGIAHAQSALPYAPEAVQSAPPAAANDTMAQGLLDGEMLAEGTPTGGKLGVGLGVGVLTGLIGTGIGYFVVGPEQLSAEALTRSAGKSADYQLGLKTGWEKKTKSKKRNAFLAGGLLGTAAWIVMIAAAQSGE